MQNLVQAKEERLPIEAINKNVDRAKIALNGKKVCECTEDEIKAKLTLIYSLVGLRPQHYPIGQEKVDLHNYIVLKFGQKTLSELVLAFDLAISCELELTKDEVKIYDQFTISYLANIMAAYKSWLRLQANFVTLKPQPLIEAVKDLTKEDWLQWIEDVKKYPTQLVPVIIYDYLNREKIINYTTEQKKEFLNQAIQFYIATISEDRVELKNFLKQKEGGVFTEPYAQKLKDLAKKIAVKKYLK